MTRLARMLLALVVAPALAATALTTMAASPGAAHEERPAEFPDGTGARPGFLGFDNPRQRVVCKADSGARIAAMPDGAVKHRNEHLLERCEFRSIQTAINTIDRRRTSIYVLPGVYSERQWAEKKRSHYCSHLETQSDAPLVSAEYIGSLSSPDPGSAAPEDDGTTDPIALSYADQRRCAHNLNLIALFGDRTPGNDSIGCDSKFCGTQIVGTGRRMTDVIIDNRFQKLNALRLDRMGGALVRNLTVQQAEFNALYVMETDGFVIDRVTARGNDEYGILAFASDHGLIQQSNAYYNGDSGIYPGSGSDLNADNPNLEATRYAIEIRNNRSHHNTLGYSGTAGNSIWAHDNDFHDNATGIATDSLFPGHPGLPQDHARWSRNRIYSNNSNWYTEFVDQGVCDKPMAERGYIDGTVCPVVPDARRHRRADRRRQLQLHRPQLDLRQLALRHHAVLGAGAAARRVRPGASSTPRTTTTPPTTTWASRPTARSTTTASTTGGTTRARATAGRTTSTRAASRPTTSLVDPPACADGGSVFTPGAPVKDAGFLSCSEYDRARPDLPAPARLQLVRQPPEAGRVRWIRPARPARGRRRALTP